MGILQARLLEWVATPSSRGSSQLRDRTQVFCIAGRFFTIYAPEKPKNIGVGSLSLHQGILLTQGLNQGLLHYRQILYQLSHKDSSEANKGQKVGGGPIPGNLCPFPKIIGIIHSLAYEITLPIN